MGVVIESSVWELNPSLFIFIFICCLVSVSLSPHASKHPSNFDLSISSSFLRFQRKFLLLFSLASVMEGLWAVYGESELASYGVKKEQIVVSICVGHVAALVVGTFLGMLSDSIGHKKTCLIFCVLHLVVGVCKRIMSGPSIWLASLCLSLASSIYSFSFEAWVALENEKQGHRHDVLNNTFWLMTFFESASYIGSQILANWMVGSNAESGIVSPSNVVIFFALICIIWIGQGWKESPQTTLGEECTVSYSHIFSDKRICLLGLAHACLQFSIVVFWILWAPTLVADGREVNLGLIYPCFLGARMLGSTIFPWLLSGPSSLRTEDCLVCTFMVLGAAFSIIAYDYLEIGVLVSLFCLFHAGVGFIMPSLARLRTMHVPNELRGGMISLSLAPANAVLLLVLIQRGYYQNIENSTMMAFSALGLFMAAGGMYLLKRWGKQPYQNWHKL